MKSLSLVSLAFLALSCTWYFQKQAITDTNIAFRTLLQDGSTFQFGKVWTFVIKSKQDEEGFMKTSLASRQLPAVDYSTDMVICLLAGRAAGTTSVVTIDSVVEKPTVVRVYSHLSQNGSMAGGGHYPAHIIALPRIDKGIQFDAYP